MKKTTLLLFVVFCLFGIGYGQMSNEKTNIIITMAQQYDATDFTQRTQFMSRKDRRAILVDELKHFSKESQADLLTVLEAAKDDVSDINSFWVFNGISCKASKNMIDAIAQRSDVSTVKLDKDYQTQGITYEENEAGDRGLEWNIAQIQADKVWTYTNDSTGYTGKGIVVAILDSGVNYNHNDIANHMWESEDYPWHGYNFVQNTANPLESQSNGNGQGTMVAGVIVGDGTSGFATGIAQDAKIMAVKISNTNGVTNEAKVNSGIQFALEQGADIVLVSACEASTSTTTVPARESYRNSMNNLLTAGIVAITSAGDLGQSIAVPYSIAAPSNCPSPWHNPDELINAGRSANICVGATNKTDTKLLSSSIGPVTWSNIGEYNDYPYIAGSTTQVGHIRPDVCAPGISIKSASYQGNASYKTGHGTAMSAAHVAAVAAMMLEANPNLTPADIDRILETTAKKCEGLASKNNYYGAGRIDALEAINAIKATVNPPTNLSATSNLNQVSLTWTAATNAASYDIYCNEELLAQGVTGTSYSYTSSTSGSHTYYLRSNRSNGSQSTKSNYASTFITPEGPVVTNLTAELNDQTVTLSWDSPTSPSVMRYGTAETHYARYGEQNNPTYWAQRFPSSTLVNYAGCTIDSLSLYFLETGTYTVSIYNGNANGTNEQLFNGSITVNNTNCWTSIYANVLIDHTQDLWIVAYAPKAIANPAAYCKITSNPSGYTSLKCSDGINWETHSNSNAWMMKAILSSSSYTYNVLRNETTIATGINTLSYTDANLSPGTYYYTVTTNYNNESSTSFPSESVRVDIDTRFTVTLEPGSGTCTVASVQQEEQDGPVTLPEATPSSDCAAEGYTFVGWSTEIIEGATTEPELILAGAEYVPTDDITLYAVYRNVQGEQGWQRARTIHDGDSVRIVCVGYTIEFNDENGNGAAYTLNNPRYTFTINEVEGGYTFKDASGRYMYRTNYALGMTNNSTNAVWTIDMISSNAYIRNEGYQIMGIKKGSSSMFQCVTYEQGIDSENKIVQLYRYTTSSFCSYDHNPDCGQLLQAPKISPVGDGIFLGDVTLTMTAASGATIRYTLDGTEPTSSSTKYNSSNKPVITTTTTVKARAFKSGYTNSAVNEQTYTFATEYNDIASFKADANSDIVAKITSTMRAVQQYGRYLYICDNTGGLLVYDDFNFLSSTFADGDYIENVQGRYQVVNDQPMLVLMHDIEKTGENSPVDPTTITVQEANSNYSAHDAQLTLFEAVQFASSQDTLSINTLTQDGNQLLVYDKFDGVSSAIDMSLTYDVVGFMGIEDGVKMVYPRSNTDIRNYYNITCEPTENGTLSVGKTQAACHSTILVEATPNPGCHIKSLYYYGEDPEEQIDIDQTTLSFEMPEYDITIVAVFQVDEVYTVNLNPGSGTCESTSLTETTWGTGVTLPDAEPSDNCTNAGYTFQGWADHLVTETMATPQLYLAGSTYYPEENTTLYAVYATMSDSWVEISSVEDLVEGNYVITSIVNNTYYFLYQEGETTYVSAKRMKVTDGVPMKYMTQPDPKNYLWTVQGITDSDEYSITYADSTNTTYYLMGYADNDLGVKVSAENPNNGWVFANGSTIGKDGIVARFPSTNPAKAVRYLDCNMQRWIYIGKYDYIGELHFFLGPSNVYSTIPNCQMPVETPEFVDVPEGDITTDEYMVTITCATEGATIYYTTDGTEPDDSATTYTGAFAISENCTVKAIAYNSEGEYSYVATQEFSFITRYANIAAFKAAFSSSSSDAVRIAGDVIAVYQHGAYLYIVDETAGLLVKDNNSVITNTYENGDTIQGGIIGRFQKTSSQVWMLATVNPAEGVAGPAVEPEAVSIYTINSNYDNYDAKLVSLTNVTFSADYDLSSQAASYTVQEGSNTMNVVNQFGTITMTGEADDHYDIIGFVGRDNYTTRRLYPRADEDFIPYYNIQCTEGIEGGSVTANAEYARVNDVITLTATPQAGYELGQYTVTDSEGNPVTVAGNNFEMPASDVTVTATFQKMEYLVSVEASPAEGGNVTIEPANGPYYINDVVTVTATANSGYVFSKWEKNGVTDSYYATTTFTVTSDLVLTAVFEVTQNFHITAQADPAEGGTVTGSGNYSHGSPVTVTATPNFGWIFVNWTENDSVISTETSLSFTATQDRTLTAHFYSDNITQTVELSAGWNWFSSYVEYDSTSLGQLQNGIATISSSAMIKGQLANTQYDNGSWHGTLNSLNNEEMYLILSSDEGEASLVGLMANPEDHPITLASGWNWIGYIASNSMTVAEALSGITPSNGDMIKGQSQSATYSSTLGEWNPDLVLTPGQGYLYLHSGDDITLVYPSTSKGIVTTAIEETYWSTDYHAFPTNLSMMVTLDENVFGMAEGSHEIGAFVNGECRGSARLRTVNGKYIAFLTITGEEGEAMNFQLYDVTAGTVYGIADEQISYMSNDIYGSVENPMVLHFRNTGLDELTQKAILFPNPATTYVTIQCKDMYQVSIYSITGQLLRQETVNADETQVQLTGLDKGLYLMNIYTNEGFVFTKKLEIK